MAESKNLLDTVKRLHFVGIGGSGMCPMAEILHHKGYVITGSDINESDTLERIRGYGIPVSMGHRAENIGDAELVVYTAAAKQDNPELVAAREKGVPTLERSVVLGLLTKKFSNSIAVSGTHGKTTTTSMLAQAFLSAGADPTIHIGGELDFIGGSTRRGGRHDFIVEACEFHASFLHFYPTVAIVLNIDEDHLDFFRDIDHIEQTFAEYVALLPEDGWCIAWGDDPRARRVCEGAKCNHLTYGLGEDCDLRAVDVVTDERGCATYTAVLRGERLGRFHVGVSSQANMLDSMAVVAAAHIRGLDMEKVAQALSSFVGAHRRFELTSVTDGVRCYTDYGHNPAEIKNAIQIAKLQPHGTLWSVWQPHTYSRTKTLFNAFLETFDGVDRLLITDICAARETDPGDISSEMLIEPLRARGVDAVLTPTFDDAEAYLRAHWQPGDLMISHGCGDIDLLNEQIANHGNTVR